MNRMQALELIDATKTLKKRINSMEKTYKENVTELKKYFQKNETKQMKGSKYELTFSDKKNEDVNLLKLFLVAVGDELIETSDDFYSELNEFLNLISPKKTEIDNWLNDVEVPRTHVITEAKATEYHKANFKKI